MPGSSVCRALSIVDARPTSPTTVDVILNPPAGSGPVDSYQVTACPDNDGTCIRATCKTAECTVAGLTPGTSYTVTAVAILDGQPLPTSNTVAVSTPLPGAPALTSANDLSSTTAQATAEPPPGVTFTQV